jgi:L-fuconolactonase
MTLRIDAHQHFWELRSPFDHSWMDPPRLAPLRRTFLPDDLAPLIQSVGIDRTVFVQTQHMLAENDWVFELAAQHDFIAGVVGWVDLASSHCEEQIERLKCQPNFVGFRHLAHNEPDHDFIVRDDVVRGLAILQKHGVPFDLLFYIQHLKHVRTLAERLPGLRLVIDHLAKPQIKDGRMEDWLPDFRTAANYPNVFCKLSGLVTEAVWNDWSVADLRPYVQRAMELFGPERCMFGSDWPVCTLAGSYEAVYYALDQAIADFNTDERDAVFGGTAARFYGFCSSP